MARNGPFHRVEFYERDLDHQILVREIPFVPCKGEHVALGASIYVVEAVSYNLDYLGSDYEVWRANVILTPKENGE